MDLRNIPAALSLLLLAAASAPQPESCDPTPPAGADALPAPLDLAGRPNVPAGFGIGSFAELPVPPVPGGCRSPLPFAARSTSLGDESGDVLHGLPAPDILRPMDEPKRAPLFQ